MIWYRKILGRLSKKVERTSENVDFESVISRLHGVQLPLNHGTRYDARVNLNYEHTYIHVFWWEPELDIHISYASSGILGLWLANGNL